MNQYENYKYYLRVDGADFEFTPANADELSINISRISDEWYDYILELDGEVVLAGNKKIPKILLEVAKKQGFDSGTFYYLVIKTADGNDVYTGLVNQQDLDFSEYKDIYKIKAVAYNPYSIIQHKKSKAVNILGLPQVDLDTSNFSLFAGNFKGCVKLVDVITYIVSEAMGVPYAVDAPILQNAIFNGIDNVYANCYLTSTSNIQEAIINTDYDKATKLEMSFDKLANNLREIFNVKFALDEIFFKVRTQQEIDEFNTYGQYEVNLTLPEFQKYVRNIMQYTFSEVEIPNSEKWAYSASQTRFFEEAFIQYNINESLRNAENQITHPIDWVADINGVAVNPDKFPKEEASIIQCDSDNNIIYETVDFDDVVDKLIVPSVRQAGQSDVYPYFPETRFRNRGKCTFKDIESQEKKGADFFGQIYFATEPLILAANAEIEISFNAFHSFDFPVSQNGVNVKDYGVWVYAGSTVDPRDYVSQQNVYSNVMYFGTENGLGNVDYGDVNYSDAGDFGQWVKSSVEKITRNSEPGANIIIFQFQQPYWNDHDNYNVDRYIFANIIDAEFNIALDQTVNHPNPDLRPDVLAKTLHTHGRYLPTYTLKGESIASNSLVKRKKGYEVAIPMPDITQYNWNGLFASKLGLDGLIETASIGLGDGVGRLNIVYDSVKRPSDENECIYFGAGVFNGRVIINNDTNVITGAYDNGVDVTNVLPYIRVSYLATYTLSGNDFSQNQQLTVIAENGDVRTYTITMTENAEAIMNLFMAGIFYTPIAITGSSVTFTSPGNTPEEHIGTSTPSAWQSTYDGEIIPCFITTPNFNLITRIVFQEVSIRELNLRSFTGLTSVAFNYFASSRPSNFEFIENVLLPFNSNVWTEIELDGEFNQLDLDPLSGDCSSIQLKLNDNIFTTEAIDNVMIQVADKGWNNVLLNVSNNLGYPSFLAHKAGALTGGATYTIGKQYTDETGRFIVSCESAVPEFRTVERGKYCFNRNKYPAYMKSTGLSGQYVNTGYSFDPDNDFVEILVRFDASYEAIGSYSLTQSEVFFIQGRENNRILIQLGEELYYANVDSILNFNKIRIEGRKLYVNDELVHTYTNDNTTSIQPFYLHALNDTGIPLAKCSIAYFTAGQLSDGNEDLLIGVSRSSDGIYYNYISKSFVVPSTLFTTEISKFEGDNGVFGSIELQSAYDVLIENSATITY